MKHLWLKIVALASVCSLFAGCAMYNVKIDSVLVELTSITPDVQPGGVRIGVRYVNENIFAIGFSGISGKLYLNNQYAGSFKDATPIGIQQLKTLDREFVLQLAGPDVLQRLKGAATASYRLEAVLLAEVSEDKSKIYSVRSGQVAVPDSLR